MTTEESGLRDRPMTEASYGIPSEVEGTLPWSFVEETLVSERTFWVATVRPDGRPHPRPIWGVWVGGRVHCGGGEFTRWVRNLATGPSIVVHTESAESVVIVEGTADRIDEGTAPAASITAIDEAYQAKYGIRHGTPFFAVNPSRVLAWSDFLADATRWRFDGA